MNEKLLHIENVSVGYHGKPILENFSLDIAPGELIGLKGRNGKGKTTLLKTICGLIPPVRGNVFFKGAIMHKMLPSDRAKCISIVLTEKILLGGITVRGLVEMGRFPNQGRFHFSHDDGIANDCLHKLQIAELAEKPLSEISDGELQKTMIARALAQQTPIILMDEPTAFLDYVAKEELFALLSHLVSTEKISILFSSHDISAMEQFSTRIISI